MVVQNSSLGMIILALVVVAGAVAWGASLTQPVARSDLAAAETTKTPLAENLSGELPSAQRGFPTLEVTIILTLLGVIAGLVIGIALFRPIIYPGP